MDVHHVGVRVDDLERALIEWICTWGVTLEGGVVTEEERCVLIKKGEVRLELVETTEPGAHFHVAWIGTEAQVAATSAVLEQSGFTQTDEMVLPVGEQAYYFVSESGLEIELIVRV